MSKFLQIHVGFATGRYHGKEWPPSPMRLFQALVAGAATIHVSNGELPEVIVSIFRWLERQDPPMIYAPDVRRSSMHVASVPNNDDDITMQDWINGKVAREIEADRNRRYTMKVTPRRLVNGKILYIWDIAHSDVEIAREVVRLAELLHCLGRGIDAAWGSGSVGESVSNKGLPCWVPLKGFSIGGERLRVPMPGSIDSLIERQRARYARMRTREFVSLQPRYQEVAYTFDGTVESRPYFLYQVRTLDGRKLFPWRQHNAVTLAAMVRHALDTLHKTSDSDLRSFVMGHVAGERYKSNRLSWVPLPSIGHVHADGRIRRVMLLGPRGSNFDLMKRAVFGMQFIYLTLDRQQVALLTQTDEIEGAVMPYLATSDEWFTITLMVLPGHTTRGRRQPGKLVPQKISRLLIKALAQEAALTHELA